MPTRTLHIFSILLCWWGHTILLAQPCPVTWGPTLQLSNTSSSAFVPKLAVVGDTVHLTYRSGSLFYRRSTDAGLTWSDQFVVVPAESLPGQIWNRPFAASGSNLYVVWRNSASSGFGPIKVRRSTDGGRTWLQPEVIVRNPGTSFYSGPLVAAHENDVFVAMHYSAQTHVFFTRSTNRGETWDSVQQITFGTLTQFKNDITAGKSAVHIVVERGDAPSGREIGYLVSIDRGITWSPSQLLSTIDNYQAWEPNVAANDAGNVYVSWQDAKYGSAGFGGSLLMRKSTDNGLTWGDEMRITTIPSVIRSSLAVTYGRVFVNWDDERFGSLNSRIYFSMSSDQTTAWCDEIQLSQSSGTSVNPAIAANSGKVYAFWSNNADPPSKVYAQIGEYKVVGVLETGPVPMKVALAEPYPNPFNSQTIIRFELPWGDYVHVTIYDLLGREVKSLLDEFRSAGTHTIVLDVSNLSAGTYFVVLKTARRKEARKALLLR